MNPSLARVSSPSITDEVAELEESVVDEEPVVEEPVLEEHVVEEETVLDEEEDELQEITYKDKTYYLVNGELFTKKKNGKQGRNVGKMINGKPKLNKKKKKVES